MKTSSEFPGVYRVRTGAEDLIGPWWRLERLELGAFCYKWRRAESWRHEPNKEEVADAIEMDRRDLLRARRHASFEPYFVTSEGAA